MIEHLASRLVDWLTERTADDWRHYTLLLIGFVVAYRTIRWLIRTAAPFVLGRVVFPLVAAVVFVFCTLLVGIQGLAVIPYRMTGAHPPRVVVGLGDLGAGTARRTFAAIPGFAFSLRFLRRTPRLIVLAVLVAGGWYAHRTNCQQDPAARWCTKPVAAANLLSDDLWTRTERGFRDTFG